MVVLAFCIWGFTSTVILRHVPLFGPAATQAGATIGACTLLLISNRETRRKAWALVRTYPLRMFGVTAAFALTSGLYHWSIKTTSIANASLSHSQHPLFACLLFMPLYMGIRPSKTVFAALGVGTVGMAVLLGPQFSLGTPLFG